MVTKPAAVSNLRPKPEYTTAAGFVTVLEDNTTKNEVHPKNERVLTSSAPNGLCFVYLRRFNRASFTPSGYYPLVGSVKQTRPVSKRQASGVRPITSRVLGYRNHGWGPRHPKDSPEATPQMW